MAKTTTSTKSSDPVGAEFNSYGWYSDSSIFGFDIFDEYDADQLKALIKNPMVNREKLRALCETIYNSNGVVTNVIDYMVSLPTLDYIAIPYGEADSSKERSKKIAETFLKTIRHKEIVRDILRSVLIGGDYYGYCDFGDRPLNEIKSLSDFEVRSIVDINAKAMGNASIITLPVEYCKIVGYKNNVPIVSMNLEYFNSDGNEPAESKLRKYPKEIREAYNVYTSNKTSNQWIKLNTDNTIAIKYRSSRLEPYGRPLPLAALANVLYQEDFVKTKRTILSGFRNKIYYETFPGSDKKGVSALSEKQQKTQHEALKGAFEGTALRRDRTSFISVAADTKLDSIKMDGQEILDEKYEKSLRNDIAADMGFAGALLSGAGENASYSSMEMNARLISSQVFQIIEMISEELNKCLNANLIRSTSNSVEVYYLPITYINRKEIAEMAKNMYLQGHGSLFYWAAATGLKPDAFMALAMEEKAMKLDEILPVHQTSFTQSSKDSAAGRPPVDNPTNQSTVQTRARNSNKQPKPSTK